MYILLIEDDPATQLLLDTACKSRGHLLHWSETALEGLSATQLHPFDVVLCDINLPDVNGLVLAQALQEKLPGVPLVFLTASENPTDQEVGQRLGAAAYLLKPFDADEVITKLEDLVLELV